MALTLYNLTGKATVSAAVGGRDGLRGMGWSVVVLGVVGACFLGL